MDEHFNILSYQFAATGVHVDFRSSTASGEGSDSFRGFSTVVGSMHEDELIGRRGSQTFIPLAGTDTVRGNAGDDSVQFLMWTVDSSVSSGIGVNLAPDVDGFQEAAGAGEGHDYMTGIETAFGTKFSDGFGGGPGYDAFYGLDGQTRLYGARGFNILNGGSGSDSCTYGTLYVDCEGIYTPDPPTPDEPPPPV